MTQAPGAGRDRLASGAHATTAELDPARPVVSCLCVTGGRPAFLPWLLWNYDKQDYQHRELVVVDDSPVLPATAGRADCRVVRVPPGTSVGRKRNLALAAARGDVITWFDDDDWQHPRKLSLLVEALGRRRAVLAGCSVGWFVDLATGQASPHAARRGVLFNGCAVRRDRIGRFRFDEDLPRGADSVWLSGLSRACAPGEIVRLSESLFCWLRHQANLSNPRSARSFPHPPAVLRAVLGAAAWADTDAELDRLRASLWDAGQRIDAPAVIL